MTILIDTQVLIWLINDDPRLGRISREYIQDSTNTILISYFSFFEITIKSSIGKMTFDPSVIDDLPKMGLVLLQPSNEHLSQYQIHNPNNKDPFDSILITVAQTEQCIFMTADTQILTTKTVKLLDATL